MIRWIALMLALGASVLCAARRRLTVRKALASLAAANGAWALLELFEGPACLVLAAGLAGSLLGGLGRRETLLPEVCAGLAAWMAFFPLGLGGEEVWRYGACIALVALCVQITLWQEPRRTPGPLQFYPEKPRTYALASAVPCAVLVPEALVLAVCGQVGAQGAAALCCAFLALLYLALWLQEELCRRVRSEELRDAMDRWQSESRDYINTIRAQRHDFNLHLHAISGLLGSGDYEKCAQYVSALAAEANAVNDIMPVNDAVVGSMLYNMRQEARRRGSEITYDITYDMAETLCSGFECNKIIGNLLQNAIDALQTPEDLAFGIRLSIFKRRGNTVILCENRFTGDPDKIAAVFEPGYSTKRGHEGIGLSMVLRTVTRRGGRVYPEFDGEAIRFVVNIPNKVDLLKGGQP